MKFHISSDDFNLYEISSSISLEKNKKKKSKYHLLFLFNMQNIKENTLEPLYKMVYYKTVWI